MDGWSTLPTLEEQVISLCDEAVRSAPVPWPGKAKAHDIDALERRYAIRIPAELREWLCRRNGAIAGPGVIFGVNTQPEWLDIGYQYTLHPAWPACGWIPVAGDGTGNHYVLDTRRDLAGSHPIYFIDHEQGDDHPTYVVASGLWRFLWFLLRTEQVRQEGERPGWPFDRQAVLRGDPALAQYEGLLPLPWET